jgi:hypothetical protein
LVRLQYSLVVGSAAGPCLGRFRVGAALRGDRGLGLIPHLLLQTFEADPQLNDPLLLTVGSQLAHVIGHLLAAVSFELLLESEDLLFELGVRQHLDHGLLADLVRLGVGRLMPLRSLRGGLGLLADCSLVLPLLRLGPLSGRASPRLGGSPALFGAGCLLLRLCSLLAHIHYRSLSFLLNFRRGGSLGSLRGWRLLRLLCGNGWSFWFSFRFLIRLPIFGVLAFLRIFLFLLHRLRGQDVIHQIVQIFCVDLLVAELEVCWLCLELSGLASLLFLPLGSLCIESRGLPTDFRIEAKMIDDTVFSMAPT